MGAQLEGSSNKTNDVAGDGTTTATVLAQAMVKGLAKRRLQEPTQMSSNSEY